MEFTQEKIRRLSKMVRDMQLSDEDTQAIAEAQLKDMAIDPRVKTLFERFVSASNLNLYIDPSITSADFENALKSWLTFLVENPQTVIDDHFDPFLENFYAAVEEQYKDQKKIDKYYKNNKSIQKIYKNKSEFISEFINDGINTDLMVETLRKMGKFKNTREYGGSYDVQFRSDIAELAGRLTKEDFYPISDIETLTVLRRRALQEILGPGFELYINDIKKHFNDRIIKIEDLFVLLAFVFFVSLELSLITGVLPLIVGIIVFGLVLSVYRLFLKKEDNFSLPSFVGFLIFSPTFFFGVLILCSIFAFPLNAGIAIFFLSFTAYLAIKAYPQFSQYFREKSCIKAKAIILEKSATDLQNLYDEGDQNIKTEIENAIEAITKAPDSEDNTKALSTGTSANASSTPTSVVDQTIAIFTKSYQSLEKISFPVAKLFSRVTSTQQSSLQSASMHGPVARKNIFEPLIEKHERALSNVSSLTSSSKL